MSIPDNNCRKESLREYKKMISKYKLLNREEERELFIKCQNGDEKAREKLILHNLAMVLSIASNVMAFITERNKVNRFDIFDLIQEGNIELMNAVNSFDVSRDCKFFSYAYPKVKLALFKYIKFKNRDITVPKWWFDFYNHLIQYSVNFQNKEGRMPTILEYSNHFHVKQSTIENIFMLKDNPMYLEALLDSECSYYNAILVDDRNEFVSDIEIEDRNQKLLDALKNIELTTNERYVLENYFGFLSDPKNCGEIGRELGISKQRTNAIKMALLKKLRSNYKLQELIEYEINAPAKFTEINIKNISKFKLEMINKEAATLINCRSLFDLFKSIEKDEVLSIIHSFSYEEREILRKKFGTSFTIIISDKCLSNDELVALYWTIIPRMKRIINEKNNSFQRKRQLENS